MQKRIASVLAWGGAAFLCAMGFGQAGEPHTAPDGEAASPSAATGATAMRACVVYYDFWSDANDQGGLSLNGRGESVRFENGTARFDGVGSSIEIADGGVLSGMRELRVLCRFQAEKWPDWEADGGSAALVSKENDGDGNDATDSYYIAITTLRGRQVVQAGLRSRTGKCTLEGAPAKEIKSFKAVGTWHEVALILDARSAKLVLDGHVLDQAEFAGPLNSTPSVPLRLGVQSGHGRHDLHFKGLMDSLLIVAR